MEWWGNLGVLSPPYDTDAQTFITAVEAADGQYLETAVRDAINAFVVGCKADGIWSAIKACCILAGARTLAGALIPLVGTAPTNNGFVTADYNRKTGLIGNGVNKWLNSNRNNNADPQNSQHLAAYVTQQANPTGTNNYPYISTTYNAAGGSTLGRSGVSARVLFVQMRYGSDYVATAASAVTGFAGASIGSGSSFSIRWGGNTYTQASTSQTPSNESLAIFRDGTSGSNYTASTLSFYGIGTNLNLSLLDARVSALMSAITAAIP